MPDEKDIERFKSDMTCSCNEFRRECFGVIKKNMLEQHPRMAILCCSDSRVPPEIIFGKNIGEIFDVRVAGNLAMDSSVIFSLEYAVEHLGVELLLILGHTRCGAVTAAENITDDVDNPILREIRSSFSLHSNRSIANLMRQVRMLPERSEVIRNALAEKKLSLLAGLYHIEDGSVEFLDVN